VLGIMLSLPPLFFAMDHEHHVRASQALVSLPVLHGVLVGQAILGIAVVASALLSLRKGRIHVLLLVAGMSAAGFGAATSALVLATARLGAVSSVAVASPAVILITCAILASIAYACPGPPDSR
jgi:hypothetical protein